MKSSELLAGVLDLRWGGLAVEVLDLAAGYLVGSYALRALPRAHGRTNPLQGLALPVGEVLDGFVLALIGVEFRERLLELTNHLPMPGSADETNKQVGIGEAPLCDHASIRVVFISNPLARA